MKPSRPKAAQLELLLPLLLVFGPAQASAQEAGDEEARREAELFGEPTDGAETPKEPAAPEGGEEGGESGSGDDEESRREAEMFGGGDDEGTEEGETRSSGGESREDALFGSEVGAGGGLTTEGDIDARLGESYDTLDIGGRLFLRLDYASLEEGDPEAFPLTSQNLLDLYLDGRPNDRVRTYLSGRLVYDPTVDEDAASLYGIPRKRQDVQLDQLWLRFDIERALYFTVGRQRVRWGAGRFWNPTDFLNPQRLDPLAVLDQRLGSDLIKVHLPLPEANANLYAVAVLSDANAPEKVGVAGRAEVVVGEGEVSASAEWRKDTPLRLGADASFGLWWLDLRAEAAVLRGDRTRYWEGEFAPDRFVFPTAVSKREDWLVQAVVGADMTIPVGDEDSVIVGAEYFYNPAGYANADLYPWLLFAGGFTPLYLGQHYAGTYVTLLAPGDWDDTSFVLSTLGNLSDLSFLSRFDVRVQSLTWMSVNLYLAAHYGRVGELHLGIEVPAIPVVPELAEGLSVPPQLLDAGVSLVVTL